MRKVIGIVPLYDDEKDSYWMLPGYMKMLEAEHAVPLMLPLTDDTEELGYFLDICTGFLLTGGHDVSPAVYGQERQLWCGQCCELRDTMEKYILRNAVKLDKAVLGICRGIQFMNACFGGTLYQDLEKEHESSIDHHMQPPYDRVAHYVNIQRGSVLYDILGKERLGVNSYHHQAIKDLSSEFERMAVSDDGLTEAISMPGKKCIIGVQWHPEFAYLKDEDSRKLIRSFVGFC